LHRRSLVRSTAAVCGLLLATACGEQTDQSATPGAAPSPAAQAEVAADDALAAMVPEEIAADGVLVVGTDATYAPNEFLAEDGTTVQGLDVDLFDAVAAKLGLEARYEPAPFDAIITGVQSGKYEVGVSSFTINDERKQQVDMVSYFSAGTSWAAPAGNPGDVDIENACGKRIAVQRGTVQVEDITARSEACTAAGQPEIVIDQYQGQDQATSAVVSGKDDAMLADSPVAAYAVQQTQGGLELLGDIYDAAPYGYVLRKDQGEFPQAVAGAVDALIADGTYAQVLDTWGVGQGALPGAEVNP